MTSLSPSLISALIHVPDHAHHSHAHTAHALPPAETIEEEVTSPAQAPAVIARSSGKEEKKQTPQRKRQTRKKAEKAPEPKRAEEHKEEVKAQPVEAVELKGTPPHLPVPQRTVSMPTPMTQPPVPPSPPTPQLAPISPSPLRQAVPSPRASPSPLPAPAPPVPHFGPLDELSCHVPIRMAMRGRHAGSIVLIAAGERAGETDQSDEAASGRLGSMPVSHYKDWASLTAIQHLRSMR